MKLEDQVCTFEQAKKLKDLGVTRVSDTNNDESGFYYVSESEVVYFALEDGFASTKYLFAPTVAELGVMMPMGYDTMRVTGDKKDELVWRGYDHDGNDYPSDTMYLTEVQARTSMVMHMLDSKYITAEEVNKSLNQ